jgi:hypothetical protein
MKQIFSVIAALVLAPHAFALEMPLGNLAAMARTASIPEGCSLDEIDFTSPDLLMFRVANTDGVEFDVRIPRVSIDSWSESRTRVAGVPYWRFSGETSTFLGTASGERVIKAIDWLVNEDTNVTQKLEFRTSRPNSNLLDSWNCIP